MNVSCPKCSASHAIANIPDGGMSYVCPSCSHCFHVDPAQTTPRVSLRSIGGARVLESTGGPAPASTDYFVKRSTGRIIGPFKVKMIEQMVRSGQIESATEISTDKVQWARLSTLPEFASVFKEDNRPGVSGRTNTTADNLPSARPAAAPALHATKPAQPPQASLSDINGPRRPNLKLADVSIGELPIARSNQGNDSWGELDDDLDFAAEHEPPPTARPADPIEDLPKPRAKQTGANESFQIQGASTRPAPSDLPIIKPSAPTKPPTPARSSAADLPAQKPSKPSAAPLPLLSDPLLDAPVSKTATQTAANPFDLDLPSPAAKQPPRSGATGGLDLDIDLPILQGGLPASKSAGLPSTKPTGLPSAKPTGLPSAKPAGLPTSKPSADLPSTQQASLPSARSAGLPSTKPAELPSPQRQQPATARSQSLQGQHLHDEGLGLDFGAQDPDAFPLLSSPQDLPLLDRQAMGSFHEPHGETALGRPPLPDLAEPLPLLADSPSRFDSQPESLFDPHLSHTQAGFPASTDSIDFRLSSASGFAAAHDDPLGLNTLNAQQPALALELNLPPTPFEPSPAASPRASQLDLDQLDIPLDLPVPPPAQASVPSTAPATSPNPSPPTLATARASVAKSATPTKKPQGLSRQTLILLVAVLLIGATVAALYVLQIGPFAAPPAPAPVAKLPKPTTQGPVLDTARELTSEPLKADTFQAYEQYIASATDLLKKDDSPRVKASLIHAYALLSVRYPETKTPNTTASLQIHAKALAALPDTDQWRWLGLSAWAVLAPSDPLAKDPSAVLQKLITSSDIPFFGHQLQGVLRWQLALSATGTERTDLLTKAVQDLERASGIDANAPSAHYFKGLALDALEKPASAAEAYAQVIKHNPQHLSAILAAAHLHLLGGQPDRARDLYTRIFSDDFSPLAAPSEKAQAQYLSGLASLAANDLASAISSFQEAFKLNLRSDALIRSTADAYDRNNQPAEGATFLSETFGPKPTNLEVLLAIARLYTSQARASKHPEVPLQQAAETLSLALSTFPNHPRVLLSLADLQTLQGKPTEAEATYQQALDADPQNLDARIQLLGLVLSRIPDNPSPETLTQRADALVKDLSTARLSPAQRARLGLTFIQHKREAEGVPILEELCATSPSDVTSREALAAYYIKQANYPKALEHLESLKRMVALRATTRYQLAYALFFNGGDRARLDRAAELLQDALKDDPENIDATALLGRILFAQDNFTQARPLFEQVLARRPRDPAALFFLGRCDLATNNPANAVTHLRAAYEADRNQGEHGLYLALALEANGETKDALRLYNDIVSSAFATTDHRPFLYRGRLLRVQGGKRKNAIADFKKALTVNPAASDIHEELARALYEDKKFEPALAALKVIEDDYKQTLSPEAYVVRGLAEANLARGDEEASRRTAAISALEAARDGGYPDLPKIAPLASMNEPAMLYRYLGYLYRDAGQKSQAISSFERYLETAKTADTGERRTITGEIARLKGD